MFLYKSINQITSQIFVVVFLSRWVSSYGPDELQILVKPKYELYDNQSIGFILDQVEINMPIEVTYSLNSSQIIPLGINSTTGVIYTTESLIPFSGATIKLNVTVNDGSIPTYKEIAVHIIHIEESAKNTTLNPNVNSQTNEGNGYLLGCIFGIIIFIAVVVVVVIYIRKSKNRPSKDKFNVEYTTPTKSSLSIISTV